MSSISGGWPGGLSSAQQQQQLSPSPEANPHLYVHNVPKDSNEDELRTVFGQYGNVANVRLKVNQKVGPHAVYAFVTFDTTDEARNALHHLQGRDLRGRSLRIEFQRAAGTNAVGTAGTSASNTTQQMMLQQQQMSRAHVTQTASSSVTDLNAPHPSLMRPVSYTDQPPTKRPRANVISEQTTQITSAPGVRYVASNDQFGLIDAIKHMLLAQRPDLVESFGKFCDVWLGGSSNGRHSAAPVVWPPSQLSSSQQRLASEGNLELDTETGRWGVLLSRLISTNSKINSADEVVVLHQPQHRQNEFTAQPPQSPNACDQGQGHAGFTGSGIMSGLGEERMTQQLRATYRPAQVHSHGEETSAQQKARIAYQGYLLSSSMNEGSIQNTNLTAGAGVAVGGQQQYCPVSSAPFGAAAECLSGEGVKFVTSQLTAPQDALVSKPQEISGGYYNPQTQFLNDGFAESASGISTSGTNTQGSGTLSGGQCAGLLDTGIPHAEPSALDHSPSSEDSKTSDVNALWEDRLKSFCTTSGNVTNTAAPVWHGTVSRNEKRVISVRMSVIAGNNPSCLELCGTLPITLRSPYEEMLKKSFIALGTLELEKPEDDSHNLQEYVNYFESKNRAGVAKLVDNVYAYIFPQSALPTNLSDQLRTTTSHAARLFVLFARTTADTA